MRLAELADLIHQRNRVDEKIAEIISRPALNGHIGEYIASQIFRIALAESATNKGSDGVFTSGPLAGRSVNVKLYAKRENLLDINPSALPDYYLVLTGPKTPAASSRGTVRPLCVEVVFLFHARELVSRLRSKIGIATSVPHAFWEEAEIYPRQNNPELVISQEQKEMLSLFRCNAT